MKTLVGLIIISLLTSCQGLIPFLSSPAALEAETLIVEEAQHELNPTAAPAPSVHSEIPASPK